ncbi:PAS domain-containing protein [bacterium]|nr:PAS domain-containing protein [bacterium]
MSPKSFAERFLALLDKIDPSEVESFVLRTVQERDFIARILDALIEGIVVIDPEARVTRFNGAARRILRWPSRRRIVGERLPELVDEGPLLDLLAGFLERPRIIQNQEVVLHPQSRKVYNVHLLPVRSAEVSPPFEASALILQDLTPARDKQARNAQAEKIASLVTLTAGVAHEIKNPLNSLSIHAQLLARAVRDFLPEEEGSQSRAADRIQQSCEVIGEEVERLRKCVDDFIEAARPSRPTLAPENLNRIVESVVRMARLEFEERNIRIETHLEPDLPPLMVDEKQIQHALRNLLRNAVDAIETARRPAGERRIALRTGVADEAVALEVSDTGCGIPRPDISKIFEPYFTTKFNGSGLGLMAVARIAREHDALVSVESAAGEGTTFILEFPIISRQVKLLEGR